MAPQVHGKWVLHTPRAFGQLALARSCPAGQPVADVTSNVWISRCHVVCFGVARAPPPRLYHVTAVSPTSLCYRCLGADTAVQFLVVLKYAPEALHLSAFGRQRLAVHYPRIARQHRQPGAVGRTLSRRRGAGAGAPALPCQVRCEGACAPTPICPADGYPSSRSGSPLHAPWTPPGRLLAIWSG